MINGNGRTVKICTCNKEIKGRNTIKKHRNMGHRIKGFYVIRCMECVG